MSAPFEKAAMSGAFRVNGENGSVWVRGSVGGLSDDCHQPKRKTGTLYWQPQEFWDVEQTKGHTSQQWTFISRDWYTPSHFRIAVSRQVQTGAVSISPRHSPVRLPMKGGHPRVVRVSLVVQPARVATVE